MVLREPVTLNIQTDALHIPRQRGISKRKWLEDSGSDTLERLFQIRYNQMSNRKICFDSVICAPSVDAQTLPVAPSLCL